VWRLEAGWGKLRLSERSSMSKQRSIRYCTLTRSFRLDLQSKLSPLENLLDVGRWCGAVLQQVLIAAAPRIKPVPRCVPQRWNVELPHKRNLCGEHAFDKSGPTVANAEHCDQVPLPGSPAAGASTLTSEAARLIFLENVSTSISHITSSPPCTLQCDIFWQKGSLFVLCCSASAGCAIAMRASARPGAQVSLPPPQPPTSFCLCFRARGRQWLFP